MKSHFGKLNEMKNSILGITLRIALTIVLNNPSQGVELPAVAVIAIAKSLGTVTVLTSEANAVVIEDIVDFVAEETKRLSDPEAIFSRSVSLTSEYSGFTEYSMYNRHYGYL